MRKTPFILASSVLLFTVAIHAQQGITREQARSLAQTALRLRGDKVSRQQIQETTDDIPGYYTFGAYAPKQGNLQDVIGWLAVSKRTGQVWDTTSCEVYAFPALEKQRKRLVRHFPRGRQASPCAEGQRPRIVRKRVSRRQPEMPEVAQ